MEKTILYLLKGFIPWHFNAAITSGECILSSHLISIISACILFLRWYPFDKQYCKIEISLYSELLDFVKFKVDNFSYVGPEDLRDYAVRNTSMSRVNDGRLQVEIKTDRKLISLILTTFIPTIILNTIGHMSNYFNDNSFDIYMSLNVTVMLALTTMFVR